MWLALVTTRHVKGNQSGFNFLNFNFSMGNEIFRYGCCKPETKHIELNSNAIFTCFKSKTMLCLFFRNVEQRSIVSFIFVKSYDRNL